MNLFQCCEHISNLLHVPVRLYNASCRLVWQYPAGSGIVDALSCSCAFRTNLLRKSQKEFPLLHVEDARVYGVMTLSDGKCAVLGPGNLDADRSHVYLQDFCEGMLLLDDFYWGHGLRYEDVLARSLGGSDTSRPADSLLTARCKDEVQQRLYEKITVKGLAAALGVTPAYLSRVFHQEQGITLTDYITREKIRQACILLRTTDFTYEAIAYELGFSSQSYFGAVFKKLEGMTPKDYRRQNQKKPELFKEGNS